MGKAAIAAAARVMSNPHASRDAKAMAASILAQSGAAPKVMAMRVSPAKVLRDPMASRDARSEAVTALTQSKIKPVTSAKTASAVGRVLKDPKASLEAKSAAASALTHKDRRFGPRKRP